MRLSDWDKRLDCFVEDMRHNQFKWGQNDCLSFVGGCLKAQTGQNKIADWQGTYTTRWGAFLNYRRKLNQFGFDSIIDALDARFERQDLKLPPRGSIILRPQKTAVMSFVFGVVLSEYAAFVGSDGLVFTLVESDDLFWGVK